MLKGSMHWMLSGFNRGSTNGSRRNDSTSDERENTAARELLGDEVAVSVESGDGVDKEDSSEYGTCVDRKHWLLLLLLLLELARALFSTYGETTCAMEPAPASKRLLQQQEGLIASCGVVSESSTLSVNDDSPE